MRIFWSWHFTDEESRILGLPLISGFRVETRLRLVAVCVPCDNKEAPSRSLPSRKERLPYSVSSDTCTSSLKGYPERKFKPNNCGIPANYTLIEIRVLVALWRHADTVVSTNALDWGRCPSIHCCSWIALHLLRSSCSSWTKKNEWRHAIGTNLKLVVKAFRNDNRSF